MSFSVYIVECRGGSLYTGYAVDVEKRVREHNEGDRGARYTKSRRPVKLVYSEKLESKSKAMKREAQIKKLSRGEKIRLVG